MISKYYYEFLEDTNATIYLMIGDVNLCPSPIFANFAH